MAQKPIDNVPFIDNSGNTAGFEIAADDESSEDSGPECHGPGCCARRTQVKRGLTSRGHEESCVPSPECDGLMGCCVFGGCSSICWLIFAIVAAMNSKGLTECPTVPITSQANIPAIHVVSTPAMQWYNWFWTEHSVYNPSISNTTRMGYWRDTRTFMFRRQYAYVTENSSTPHIIVSTPLFAWTSTFHLEHCYPPMAYKIIANMQLGWQWGKNVKTTEIYRDDMDIAQATLEKDIQWSDWMMPDGWNIAVKSTVNKSLKVADMAQTISDYYVENSDWTVKDYRPDVVEPFVMSLMAVVEGEAAKSRRRRTRRLNEKPEIV